MKDLKLFLALILIVLLANDLSAQFRYGYFRVGVAGGSTNYLGDLDDDLTFKFTKAGLGLDVSYRFNPFMTARLGLYRGWARATDAVSINEIRERRNLSFRTPITEASFQVVFDFLPTDRQYQYRPPYSPYVFGGVAAFTFNPQAQLNGQWYDLQPLGTEGQFLPNPDGIYPEPYNLTQFAIPMGAGVRLALSRHLDMEIETGFRKTFTDYLDDVSGLYPDLDDLGAQNPTAAILSDRMDRARFPSGGAATNGIRGDRTQLDWYIFTVVRFNYILDWVKCPKFLR
ncbi:MAG: hypothetical protein KDE26_15265 [Bacteroidetes bacterium]|nr:hypothetical protein [Bacteroidota bacterium]MCB0844612.1 hypothetical protein [Bacteroidota bacterium]